MSERRSFSRYRYRFLKIKSRSLTVAALLAVAVIAILGLSLSAASAAPTPRIYYFTWYDSKPVNGMQSDDIVIGNLENYNVPVEVYFAQEATPRYTATIGPRDRVVVDAWPDEMGGPVKVIATNGDHLVVTQRVIYKDSFNELTAIEEKNLDSAYNFTWYDAMSSHGMDGNWILVANVDSAPAEVDFIIGNTIMRHRTIQPGERYTPMFPEYMGGPVRAVCTNGKKIIASQRVTYKNGFSEVVGMADHRLDSAYLFTWYDLISSHGMLGDWVLVANNNDHAVHVVVNIGGTVTREADIAARSTWAPSFSGVMNGPVLVVCSSCTPGVDDKIMVSQRVIYKDSFEEVQGTPPVDLIDSQYFGWYDLVSPGMNGDWLLTANPSSKATNVDVYIGPSYAPLASYNVGGNGRVTPAYPGTMNGPVRIVSRDTSVGIMASQRVIYKNSFNELLAVAKDPAQRPTLRLFQVKSYWSDAANGELSVDFRIDNVGKDVAVNSALTSVITDNGVTLLTPLPKDLGDIPGVEMSGNFVTFTLKYKVPDQSVKSFKTKLSAICEDSDGLTYTYP